MYKIELLGSHRVILVAFCIGILDFSIGTCLGWTSPIVPKLRDHTYDSPLRSSVTVVQEGWISSLIAVGGVITAPFGGKLGSKIGKKWTLMLCGVLIETSYIFLLIASEVWMIYVARLIQGFAAGLFTGNAPMYIGEIATDDIRGAIGSAIPIFLISGTLYSYCIGPYVNYMVFQLCCMAVPIFFLITFIFMPETPYFLAKKGRTADLLKSLKFLRGHNILPIEDEMKQMQASADSDTSRNESIIDILRDSGYRKAIVTCCGLLFFQDLSGRFAVAYNYQTIFASAKSQLAPSLATILIGIIQLISNLFTPFILERAGRKTILLMSAIGISSSLFALAAFFYIQAFGDPSGIIWLPVPALVIFNISYSFGFGSVPWAIVTEIFPSNVKPFASVFTSLTVWMSNFLATRWFPELSALGAYYAYSLFGTMTLMSILFIRFYVLETKGLTLQQIQEKLRS